MRTITPLGLFAACLMLIAVHPAAAQSGTGQRSPQPVFGDVPSNAGAGKRLNFEFDVSEALDSKLPPQFQTPASQADRQTGGLSTRLVGGLDFARAGRLLELTATATTAFKYYQPLDLMSPVSHSALLAATIHLPKQTSFKFEQSGAYSPSYLYELFPSAALSAPDVAIATDPEYRVDRNPSYAYASRANLTFGSSAATSLTTFGEFRRLDYPDHAPTRPARLEDYAAGTTLSTNVSRNGGFSLGYEYHTDEFGLSGRKKEHQLTLGVDYSRALSLSRRASFRLKIFPSAIEFPDQVLKTGDQRAYRIQGEAGLEIPFRLNWLARLNYHRGIETLAVLYEPVFTDSAHVEVAGLLGRRTDLNVSASYATGDSVLSRSSRKLDTYTGRARLRYAVTRSLAVYSEYLYYYYDLRAQARLAPDLPAFFEQHGGRVGFMLFIETFR